jgi:hypothetical protein
LDPARRNQFRDRIIELAASQRRKSRRHSKNRWLASPLRTPRRLIRLGFLLTNGCAAAGTPSSEDSVS